VARGRPAKTTVHQQTNTATWQARASLCEHEFVGKRELAWDPIYMDRHLLAWACLQMYFLLTFSSSTCDWFC
jgi:hypothetical protein